MTLILYPVRTKLSNMIFICFSLQANLEKVVKNALCARALWMNSRGTEWTTYLTNQIVRFRSRGPRVVFQHGLTLSETWMSSLKIKETDSKLPYNFKLTSLNSEHLGDREGNEQRIRCPDSAVFLQSSLVVTSWDDVGLTHTRGVTIGYCAMPLHVS